MRRSNNMSKEKLIEELYELAIKYDIIIEINPHFLKLVKMDAKYRYSQSITYNELKYTNVYLETYIERFINKYNEEKKQINLTCC
jgi:predicted RNA-binding protein with PIN domain